MLQFPNAAAIPVGVWRWPHISPSKEWACKLTGEIVADPVFLDRLEALRAAMGRPLIINSGYRTPEHNAAVSTTGDDGPHTTGRACDIRIYGAWALDLVYRAIGLGFTGIGVQQKGAIETHYIHIDDLMTPAYPRPMIWSY